MRHWQSLIHVAQKHLEIEIQSCVLLHRRCPLFLPRVNVCYCCIGYELNIISLSAILEICICVRVWQRRLSKLFPQRRNGPEMSKLTLLAELGSHASEAIPGFASMVLLGAKQVCLREWFAKA